MYIGSRRIYYVYIPNVNSTVDPANRCNDDYVQILCDFFF